MASHTAAKTRVSRAKTGSKLTPKAKSNRARAARKNIEEVTRRRDDPIQTARPRRGPTFSWSETNGEKIQRGR
jgi:hypothetical protein